MSILKNLENASRGRDKKHYPISPKLLDRDHLTIWRKNLLASGDNEAIQRYRKAMYSQPVIEALDLNELDGNHGS